ncbi:MAG: C39 family peptidase [Lentisphaeria bacterium]|nr:C39 family peptidase [Lentisphaeria bacterium]
MRANILSALLLAGLLAHGAAAGRLLSSAECARRVERDHRGYVIVERIPAIEAKRNYCVPASVEMVLRYYGAKVNQKKLGRIFDSSKKTGTFIGDLDTHFGPDGEIKGFVCKKLYTMTIRELSALTQSCLGDADLTRRNRKAISGNVDGRSANVLDRMNPAVVRRHTPRSRAPLLQLLPKLLKQYIDSGRPLLWSVAMNLDPNDRSDGFHMRVLCGYREEDGRITGIVYLDPWTGRRKYKHVTALEAAAMTISIMVVQPEDAADQ